MHRSTVRYHALRHELLVELTGQQQLELARCACCKKIPPSYTAMEIHHVDGRDWEMRKVSSHARVLRLWKEYRAGVRLAMWCDKCNAKENKRRGRAT